MRLLPGAWPVPQRFLEMNVAPTLAHSVWLPAPKGAAFCLGAARRQNMLTLFKLQSYDATSRF